MVFKNLKFFVTGVSGSGKTYIAKLLSKKLSIPFIDFDTVWNYGYDGILGYGEKFLSSLPNSFILDGIPYSNKCLDFQKYRENHSNIIVICIIESNLSKWMENIINKSYFVKDNIMFNFDFWNLYLDFHNDFINRIKPDLIYENNKDEFFIFTNFEKFKNDLLEKVYKIKKKKQHFLINYLDTLSYDKFYQDIECVNFIGYSNSFKTWDNIKTLVSWKDKIVIDLGCFHGYFSFKVEKEGAKEVIGLDNSEYILKTTNIIKKIMKSNVNFLQWEGGNETPNADIALILNMLHHTQNNEKTLQNIKTKLAIFEVEKSQIELIEKYFKIINKIDSHRVDKTQNRVILVGKK